MKHFYTNCVGFFLTASSSPLIAVRSTHNTELYSKNRVGHKKLTIHLFSNLKTIQFLNETPQPKHTSTNWFDKVMINHEMSLKLIMFFETFLVIFGDLTS